MATVTSAPVLLFKMRCMFFFTVKGKEKKKKNYVGRETTPYIY